MHFLELEWLRVEHGWSSNTLELPGCHVAEVRVVAQRLALGCLTFFAEVTATRFLAVQRIERQQFREFQIVGYAARVFQTLVEIVLRAWNRHGVPEFVSQLR